MTPERIAELRKLANTRNARRDLQGVAYTLADCVPQLLAEVERLQAKLSDADARCERIARSVANDIYDGDDDEFSMRFRDALKSALAAEEAEERA